MIDSLLGCAIRVSAGKLFWLSLIVLFHRKGLNMKLIRVVILVFFASCAMAAAPVVDFPSACGTDVSLGFYHAESIVSKDGQQTKHVDYYAALPKQCWDDVAEYADDAVPDWHTVPVIVVSGDFPYDMYASGTRGRFLDMHLGEIGMLTERVKQRFVVFGEYWSIRGDGRTRLSVQDHARQYRVYLFVPGVSRDEFRRAVLPIIAPF
jgi:hypothetical protein